MKHILLSHNLILILLVVLFCFHFNGKVTAQGIRIVPGKLYVKKDSLHVNLTMYLDGISVGSGTAFFFTPVMSGKRNKAFPCPPLLSVANAGLAMTVAKHSFLLFRRTEMSHNLSGR
ncbi:hypothetical protein [Parabacteroides goldsteinii]|uniref:hypothetical protein n=1 Tax=Parabacteroides goldsteinii TaxID=328812 RepID=UPI002637155E|nr:hypothetical protein [Parabacteroides goldsteinii]